MMATAFQPFADPPATPRDDARLRTPEAARQAEEKLRESLESNPTLFGRLARLAEAMDRKTHVYREQELERVCCATEISRIMRREHERVVVQWLEKPISYRMTDMVAYFRREWREGRRKPWRQRDWRTYDQFLPPGIGAVYVQHFQMDIMILGPLVASRLDWWREVGAPTPGRA